jgi:acetoin utilization deacetylase AcuC-like enzyme
MLTLLAGASLSLLPLSGARTLGRTPVALYTSEVCIAHDPGPGHPEQPGRLGALLNAMRTEWTGEFGELLSVREPEVDATDEQILRVHTRKHLNQIKRACALSLVGRQAIDADTLVSAGSEKAMRRAAGLMVASVDDILGGARPSSDMALRQQRAFVMVRPPGHHAEAEGPQGFCLLNNVMVGVAHAQAEYGVGRVAVLDFDVHHGNGDADIVSGRPDCLYVSSHQSPLYPNTGTVRGVDGEYGENGNVVNAPLPNEARSSDFRAAWRDLLLPVVQSFRPGAIFVSAGFDGHADDPLAGLELTDADYEWLTREIAKLNLPVISVLEGGYNLEALPRSVRAHLRALAGL